MREIWETFRLSPVCNGKEEWKGETCKVQSERLRLPVAAVGVRMREG